MWQRAAALCNSRFLIEGNERAIWSLIFVYNYSFCHSNSIDGILGAIRDLIHVSYNRKRMDADVQVWWKAVSKQCFFASDSLNRIASLSSYNCDTASNTTNPLDLVGQNCLSVVLDIRLFPIRILRIDIKQNDASFTSTRRIITFAALREYRCRPQLSHNTQLEQMKSNKQGLLMASESF